MDSLILGNFAFVKQFVATRLNSEGEQQEFTENYCDTGGSEHEYYILYSCIVGFILPGH